MGKTKTKTPKLTLVPYAYKADQEFGVRKKGNEPVLDYEDSYANEYYNSYYNEYVNSRALGNIGQKLKLADMVRVREDGFVMNMKTKGIFLTDKEGVVLLKGLLGKNIDELKKETPLIIKALRL